MKGARNARCKAGDATDGGLTIGRWTWSRWPCLRICRQSSWKVRVVVVEVELSVQVLRWRWGAWASWSVESGRWMVAGRRGGRAAYKDVLWCARSTCLTSAPALPQIRAGAKRGKSTCARAAPALAGSQHRARSITSASPAHRRPSPSISRLTTHASPISRISTAAQLYALPALFISLPIPNPTKCRPRPRRLPPPAARPRLGRRLPRRRRLARRQPLPPARRRSAPRPGRRPTPPTSTRVGFSCIAQSHAAF